MKDPVTIATGITYDRESIEKWIFTKNNNICPVTKQVLSKPADLTPNHTLRRLIQSWCTLNASNGIERVPTPKPPVNKSQITKLLNNAKSPQKQMECLKRLRSIASINETNKRCIESSGAVDFLASLVKNTSVGACDDGDEVTKLISDEALSLLFSLQLSESALKSLTFAKKRRIHRVVTRCIASRMLRVSCLCRVTVELDSRSGGTLATRELETGILLGVSANLARSNLSQGLQSGITTADQRWAVGEK
ncbi:hypothetical protein Vadar_012051 [Vaccinium darrowii]|uniref:Uncharacterized protein n=1 Tax=Vaccinium darrowii TaxID=229202 RepID=A0ACB7YN44_9ERIC|nr:hypothetical protein Vadar_012051 [Vaccinium darrowii]